MARLTRDDVTPKGLWMSRRQWLAGMVAAGLMPAGLRAAPALPEPTEMKLVTGYNNFVEFGTSKSDARKRADRLTLDPWVVTVDGLVDRPQDFALADLIAAMPVGEHIAKFRCVEGWAAVIPWQGFPLAALLDRVGVQSAAQWVKFTSVLRPEEMPGQRVPILDWPYTEGLRLDEAMHPLTLLATGMYGQAMPPQNGAPIRLVVPWKYGFKSAKSLVRITLTDSQPATTWNVAQGDEYGFFANVNPQVDHPRWSQADERWLGDGIFAARHPTEMFNGYDEVASLYAGMDLAKDY
ncbi:protein-methionine-sulfoxide reductase catalytic subunit MsrP [Paracoccus sp. p3-h83]|uniref:protein-methionine-sulfoxide reductase catalytic subunit MsrP n=1 Tax=Paracoccus sp. p3-h83 TaxID=3342805 RepID=UPI0035B711EF